MDIFKEAQKWAGRNPEKSLEDAFMEGFNFFEKYQDQFAREREKKVKKAQEDFVEMIKPYLAQYGKDTLNSFYKYWAEPFKKGKHLIRYDAEKTWDTKLRLDRWTANNFEKPKANVENNTSSGKKYVD